MDRQKKVKTEEPMIFSNDIFYFKTMMIIGGPKFLEKGEKICMEYNHLSLFTNRGFR